jgi:DNA polymerase-3 subunit alpha
MSFFDQFKQIDPEIHGIRLPKFNLNEEDYSKLDIPKGLSSLELFRLLVERGFQKRLVKGFESGKELLYRERLNRELAVIEPTDFVDYILMVWDVVNTANKNSIAVGKGRGSAASSLVLYCLGITDIDPLKYGLFFERFLSEARTTPNIVDGVKYYSDAADVDLDIEDSLRESLIDILKEKYQGHFCKISTFLSLQSKRCIKEVCKIVLGYSEEQSKHISSLIPSVFNIAIPLKKAVEEVEQFKKFVEENPKAYKIARKLEGLICSKGSHASAYIVSYNPLIETLPCEMGEGELLTSYDMDYAQLNNIKLDLLGLKAIGIINEVCKMLNIKREDFDINYDTVFSHLQDVKHPYGLFQISGDCNLRVVNKVKPKTIDHLAAVTALARPGALQFVDNYARYVNEGECKSVHPFFDDVLLPTAGLALYQEGTMKMCEKIGLTKADGEVIRKCIGKKKVKEMKKWKDVIFDTAEKNGLDKEIPEVLWKILEDSANYSFNASHSYSYGYTSAETVYLKYKYPQHFFLACLKIAASRSEFVEEFRAIQQELPYFNIQLLPPHIGKSKLDFEIEGNDIRFGLGEIKGVSDKSIDKLRNFISADKSSDFQIFAAAKEAKLNIGILSALIQSGALGHTVWQRSSKVLEAQVWNILTPKEKLFTLQNEAKYGGDLIAMLRDYLNWTDSTGKKFTKLTRLETIRKKASGYFQIYNLNSRNELLAAYFYEKNLLGFSYSTTLQQIFESEVTGLRTINSISEHVAVKDSYKLIATVSEVHSGTSKNGNKYLKLSIFDETGSCNAMLLGDKLARYLDKFEEPKDGDIVYITGNKGDDILWINQLEIQNHKVYTRLSELTNEQIE